MTTQSDLEIERLHILADQLKGHDLDGSVIIRGIADRRQKLADKHVRGSIWHRLLSKLADQFNMP